MKPSTPHIERYSAIAILLHWLIALLFIGMIGVGFYMTGLGDADLSLKFSLYQWHKSFGVTIMVLTLCRLGWRLTHAPPHGADPHAGAQQVAKAAHILLYFLTLAVPLAGWAMVSASSFNIPTLLFGEFHWPHIAFFNNLSDKISAESALKLIHKTLAYGTAVLAAGHIVAALRHQFILRDHTLAKMMPTAKKARPTE